MLILKLAIRNLLGAGLRTWLNVIVLSISYVMIIMMQGLFDGMNEQVSHAMIETEIGGGQYWAGDYDPYDPFTIDDAHAPVPQSLQTLVAQDKASPVLIRQCTIYPDGRLFPAALKGILPSQAVTSLPTEFLTQHSDAIPAIIGSRMAKATRLKVGDFVTVRWRDKMGAFDAADIEIVQIFKTDVQTVDKGQVWVSLPVLQDLTNLKNEATLITMAPEIDSAEQIENWNWMSQYDLLEELRKLVESKKMGSSIMYIVLMSLALLAIFDTQILSIFRRQKEIGMLIAMGMTRAKVVALFTVEGTIYGFFAAILAAIWGTPIFYSMATNGWAMPEGTDDLGMALGDAIYPTYSLALIAGTVAVIFIAVTIVSYFPARRIARLKPTDALRGKRA